MRKIKTFVFTVIIIFMVFASYAQTQYKPEQQLFCYGKWVMISIDKQLYVSDTSDFFYIHVSIKNTSKKALGMDLTNPWHVLYPNQWQFSDTTFRMEINERQIIPEELNAAKTSEISKKYKDNQLTMILPGETYDYYTEFNATKPKDAEISINKYLIVAVDGQKFFTDGSKMEQIKCNGDQNVDREVAIKCPIEWQKIIEKQKIHHRD